MASVKLRVSMLIDGHLFPFGTEIDEAKIPAPFRTKRNILRPGEKDRDAARLKAQTQFAERADMEELIFRDDAIPQDQEGIQHRKIMRR